MSKTTSLPARLRALLTNGIWNTDASAAPLWRRRLFVVLRVASITLTGLLETKAFSRAAALSFSSMLGLGPLVAIAMLVAGFMLDQKDPEELARQLSALIEQVAPQVGQLRHAGTDAAADTGLEQLITGFIAGSKSGAVGVAGAISLILIVIQLFTSVETTFNEIWGVRRGRSWLTRIVFYWTILTLGAVLFFASVTGLSAASILDIVQSSLGLEDGSMRLVRHLLRFASVAVLALLLAVFYRTIPNTRVWWRAAFVGALVVTVLLIANNALAFLYLKRVVLQKSLYGSLGLVPVLMFGLYVFWLFVLIGGQVSYAVQNVNFRNSQAAWGALPAAARTRLTLLVFLAIGRRFQACQPPYHATDLGGLLKVPSMILNESLSRLVAMRLVVPVPSGAADDGTDFRYQPALPLGSLTLAEFRRREAETGADSATGGALSAASDPLLARYEAELEKLGANPFLGAPLDELLRDGAK
ncbi:MAG: YihY/virulence factor BrkB family protein [Opitutaceae bacterium]|jgi:membrane protein|nr:YihY/virulence factor BrkB family protein [Opitutaceae bacterium]